MRGTPIDGGHITITSDPMTLDEVLAVARGGRVELTTGALDTIKRSRDIVDAAIERGDAIYGVTTGVGHARNERLPVEALDAAQPMLVEMHLGAMGEPLPTELVRSGMVVRLNGFARGGAGVSLDVAGALEAMLNNHIHPIIPRSGSVGSGDLGQLALLGRALLGRGDVEQSGAIVPAADALRDAAVAPVTLRPKDALAIISSNALTVGHGIALWQAVGDLLALADLVAATSMEAFGANPSFFDAAVSSARGSRGQEETASNLREALAGSARVDAATAVSVQDPISFRVVPQVHGACRDVLAAMAENLLKELNAPSDNPMVDLESERLLSNGNFHPMNVALSAESMNLALAHIGLLSERRCGQLWDAVVSSGPDGGAQTPPIGEPTPPFLAGPALRYSAAARYTRLRQLAQPVTLDVPALDLSVEDHATNASEALWVTNEIVEIVTEILTVETLIAYAKLFTSGSREPLGARTGIFVDHVGDQLEKLPVGTLPDETHDRVAEAITNDIAHILAGGTAGV
ncbi:MAG TPA: aromatic amino acid ammonia-lyase, partial [Acidimicrobiia bacterium]